MTRKNTRRQFLESAGSLLAGATFVPSLGRVLLPAEARAPLGVAGATPGARKRTLITVYLRGGADALNVVVPYSNTSYYDVRPTIAIPRKDGEEGRGVVKLNDDYGLHPSLAPLLPFWEKKQLAPVLSVGSPHPTRSHFDAQDFMEYAAPGDRTVKAGWLNRYLQHTAEANQGAKLRGLAMQQLLPRTLRGPEPVLAVPRLRRRDSEGLLDLFDDVYRPHAAAGGMGGGMTGSRKGAEEVVKVGRDTISVLREFWDVVEKAPKPKVKYPRHGLGRNLETLAKVMKFGPGVEVAALDVPSWDHHRGEARAIAGRLSAVGSGLAAFAQDLGERMDDVLILVMTEFGRNVAENGNGGTDHGHGGCMLALGGVVQGGQVFGEYGTLRPKDLYQRRDLHVDIDFRTVFQESLKGLFGFDTPKGFFPRWQNPRSLGLIKGV